MGPLALKVATSLREGKVNSKSAWREMGSVRLYCASYTTAVIAAVDVVSLMSYGALRQHCSYGYHWLCMVIKASALLEFSHALDVEKSLKRKKDSFLFDCI